MAKRRSKKPSPPLTIKAVKAKGYSPAYEKRLISAIFKARKEGKKPTRQRARGHKKAEHIERKKKEQEKFGITSQQVRAIQSFLKRFNPIGFKDIPTEEMLVAYVREKGYEAFVRYRGIWDMARKQYLAELHSGTWESRGMGYLNHLTGMAQVHPTGDERWLYYH